MLASIRKSHHVFLNYAIKFFYCKKARFFLIEGKWLAFITSIFLLGFIIPVNATSAHNTNNRYDSINDNGENIDRVTQYAQVQGVEGELNREEKRKEEEKKALPIEEITVIGARRRETLLQETGGSIQVIGGEVMKDMQVLTIEDIQLYSPGITVNGGQIGFLSIRGIGSTSFSGGTEGSSSAYIDGVYIPRVVSILQNLSDIDRVEVLRGPQGTQFGRNSMGGAVNIITGRPTDELTGSFSALAGKFDEFNVAGTVSGPVVEDKVLIRLHAGKHVRDGVIDNVARIRPGATVSIAEKVEGEIPGFPTPPGFPTKSRQIVSKNVDEEPSQPPKELSTKDTTLFRGKLEVRFNEDINLLIGGDWLRERKIPPVNPITAGASGKLASGATIPFRSRVTAVDQDSFQNIDHWGVNATLNINLDHWMPGLSFQSLSSYRELTHDLFLDVDNTDLDLTPLLFQEDSDSFQQEVQFTFDNGGPLKGILGVFFFREETEFFFEINVPQVTDVPPAALKILQGETNETNAVAVFSDWSWDFTDSLRLNAGLRWSWEEKDHNRFTQVGLMTPPILFVNPGPEPSKDNWSAFTPRFGFDYFLTSDRDHMFYFLVSRGFKAGGFSLGAQDSFDPEFAWNFESGMKNVFFDDRLQTSLSLFWMSITEQQIQVVGEDEFGGTFVQTTNAGETRVRGLEFEALAAPTDWLKLNSSLTFLDAEFQRFSAVFTIAGMPQEINASGNRPVQSPKWSISNGAQFEFPLNTFLGKNFSGMLTIRGEHQFIDDYFAGGNNIGQLNRPNDVISSANVFNARVTYTFPNENLSLSFLGRNLTNELYFLRVNTDEEEFPNDPERATISKLPADPRTFAVVLEYNF